MGGGSTPPRAPGVAPTIHIHSLDRQPALIHDGRQLIYHGWTRKNANALCAVQCTEVLVLRRTVQIANSIAWADAPCVHTQDGDTDVTFFFKKIDSNITFAYNIQ